MGTKRRFVSWMLCCFTAGLTGKTIIHLRRWMLIELACFFLSLRKRSSTTSVPSSLRLPARRKREREQKKRNHLPPPPPQGWPLHPLAVEQTLKKRRRRKKSPAHKCPQRPTKTSPHSWKGYGRHSPAQAQVLDTVERGGRQPGQSPQVAPALWSPSWPRGSCHRLTLRLRRGTVGPALTPTAACCLTAKCASSHALHLVSGQVWFRQTNHLISPPLLGVSVCVFLLLLIHKLHFTNCKTNWIPLKTRSCLVWNEAPEAEIHSLLDFPSRQYQS